MITPLPELLKRTAITFLLVAPFVLLALFLAERGLPIGPEWLAVRVLAVVGAGLVAISWEARGEHIWWSFCRYVWGAYLAACVVAGLVAAIAIQIRQLAAIFN
jgi:phosphate/sulfate permease